MNPKVATTFLLLALGAYFIVFNWRCIFICLIRRRYISMIPLIGGVVACIACYLSPLPWLNEYWWMPLLLDYGCIPGMIHFGVYHLVQWVARKR
jgi:hypothetical protein